MGSVLSSLSPARRRFAVLLAGVLAGGVLAVLAIVVVRVTDDVDAVAQDELGPVLVVPGYGGSTASVAGLAEAVREDGRDVTVVELAGDGTGDLDEQAQVLGEAVDEALDRTGSSSADVVGYSAGGVIARLWVRDHGGDEQARRVVTLGSPHHGTDIANLAGGTLGCPVACQQLASGSSLLNRLNAGDETPAGPVFVSVWTTDDQTVTPPDSAVLEGALNISVQSVCAGQTVSHGDLPDDPVVRSLVERALSRDQPDDSSAGTCVALAH
jgi:triacylglycerol esterase/lipase EstA (alpha/beta hydrolase family)